MRTRSAMRLDSVSRVRVARSSELRRRSSSRESACCLATSEVTNVTQEKPTYSPHCSTASSQLKVTCGSTNRTNSGAREKFCNTTQTAPTQNGNIHGSTPAMTISNMADRPAMAEIADGDRRRIQHQQHRQAQPPRPACAEIGRRPPVSAAKDRVGNQPAVTVGIWNRVVAQRRVQQRHADAGIGKQARVAQQLNMIERGQTHSRIIERQPRTATCPKSLFREFAVNTVMASPPRADVPTSMQPTSKLRFQHIRLEYNLLTKMPSYRHGMPSGCVR